MDVEPTIAATKRPRAKPTVVADAAPKPKRKTLSTPRKKSVAAETQPPAAPTDLNGMIATAAFYLAAERGFAPGRELDDWLEAERRVRALTAA